MSTTGLSSTTLRTIGVVLLIVGLIALVIGIIYLVVPAHSLPSFMGRVHTVSGHRSKRAVVQTSSVRTTKRHDRNLGARRSRVVGIGTALSIARS